MSRTTYDSLDLKILSILGKNARTPYLEIARDCGVSGAAVHQRIQRLLVNGTIVGSECLISPAAMGYETCAYIGIYLNSPSQYNSVISTLESIPEVVECHYTAGKYDILVKVFARNNDHMLAILQSIQDLGTARTETLISFKECFRRQVPTTPVSDDLRR